MIYQRKMWTAKCDICGIQLMDITEPSFFLTKKELIETIKDNDNWDDWKYRNGKIYCDEC